MLSPRSRNWTAGNYVAPAVPLQCYTSASHPLSLTASLSLGTQIFPSILLRPFADIGDGETEQTVWGNQSSERVEDKVLSLSLCVCVCVSLCNLSRFFRHAVRAKTTNQTTLRLRLRLGPGRRRRWGRGLLDACLDGWWFHFNCSRWAKKVVVVAVGYLQLDPKSKTKPQRRRRIARCVRSDTDTDRSAASTSASASVLPAPRRSSYSLSKL